MNAMHVFKVVEDGCLYHWVTAADAEGAVALVRETCDIVETADDPVWQVDLHAVQLPDDHPYTLTLDDELDAEYFSRMEGVAMDRSKGLPRATAPCGVWASMSPDPFYVGCSEW